MLSFKPNVRLDCSSPAIAHILYNISIVSKELLIDIRITSGNDLTHVINSKHYTDEAVDVGTHEFSDETKDKLFSRLLRRFNGKFTVLFEDRDKDNEHIHIQVKKGIDYP